MIYQLWEILNNGTQMLYMECSTLQGARDAKAVHIQYLPVKFIIKKSETSGFT